MTKLVILAGGLGTRLAEETEVRPKPMVEIGGKPILWHIMKSYAQHGVREFVVCLGYKGYVIKEYFANYFLHEADVTIDLAQNKLTVHDGRAEDWCVTLVDTGAATMTGGRLKRVAKYVAGETFCMTYGDGVGDVDITALLAAHKAGGRLATVTAVKPPGRFRRLGLRSGRPGRPSHGLHREAARRRRLDQWRLLRAGAGNAGLCRWRRNHLGAAAFAGPGARRSAERLPP
jgi:glucose-1-phosphate cytidylyltransferase